MTNDALNLQKQFNVFAKNEDCENFIEEDHQENLVDYNLIENDGNNMDDLEDQQENFSNSTVTGTVEESVIDSRNSFLFENDEETNDNDIDNNPIDDNDIRDDENNVYMCSLDDHP